MVVVVVLALTTLVVLAAPAHAHGRGTDASNYRSEVTDAPSIDGVEWAVHGGDELLLVVNKTGEELIVLGYDDEPYLRVGPDGAYENLRSRATYVNDDRYGQVAVPAEADPGAEPEWSKISDRPRAIFHDHRIHWMSPSMPPQVTDPAETARIFDWEVPFVHAGEEQVVEGRLDWVPGPPAWPWPLLGIALTLPALIGLRTRPDEHGRWPGLARPAAVVLGAVTVANALVLFDDLLAVPLPLGSVAFAALQTLLFLAIGAFGAVRGWQAGDGAFTALGVGAGAVAVGQGLVMLPVLDASQITSVFPPIVTRVLVGTSLGMVVPLGIVAFLGTRAMLPDPEDDDEPTTPAATQADHSGS
jgi:hypothetical protein